MRDNYFTLMSDVGKLENETKKWKKVYEKLDEQLKNNANTNCSNSIMRSMKMQIEQDKKKVQVNLIKCQKEIEEKQEEMKILEQQLGLKD